MNNQAIITQAFRDKGLDIMHIHKYADDFYKNRPCIMVDGSDCSALIIISEEIEVSIELNPETVSNELHKMNKWLAIQRWHKLRKTDDDIVSLITTFKHYS